MNRDKQYRINHKVRRMAMLLCFCITAGTLYAQQDPQYSMYMFDKMAINPAAAGSKDALEANVISRIQWLDIQGTPVTNALLLSAPVGSKKVCWGIEIMNDHIGPANSTSLQGNYAYNIPVGKGKLAMGLGIGIDDYAIDWAEIDYKDKNDVYASPASSTKIAPTAEAGLYYHTDSYYMGLSFNHLIQSKFTDIITDSAAAFRPHVYFIAGKAFKSASGIIWNPSLILQLAQNAPAAASLNLNVLLANKLWLGTSLKFGYGYAFMVAYKATNSMNIGYAYDLGTNNLGVLSGGTHELALTFDFATHKLKQVSLRYF